MLARLAAVTLLLLASATAYDLDISLDESSLHLRAEPINPANSNSSACATGAQLCPAGGLCCDAGSFCLATNTDRSKFSCTSDRSLSDSQPPTEGTCASGAQQCKAGGCCAAGTACTPIDEKASAFVCMPPTWPDGVPAGTSSAPAADKDGSCDNGAALCAKGAGCCAGGTSCLAMNAAHSSFICASARVIPGAAAPSKDVAGSCPSDAKRCPNGGCCSSGTSCQPLDEDQTQYVCAYSGSNFSGASFGTPKKDKGNAALRPTVSLGALAVLPLLYLLV
ncbi:hypothetical protein AURDEDRAFT_115605 [Auricularia subglabra TFB-10046 SS5]|nr:hypothetical protein AURDEDRAFT_115605 [Auricularia subglabra TFB-10046 SS5]